MPSIDSVRITPTNPRPCQTVVVEVLDSGGNPLPDSSVVMEGRPGAVHHLQFVLEGDHKIAIRASGENGLEDREVTITVAGKPVVIYSQREYRWLAAMLQLEQSQLSPYVATFSLGQRLPRRTSDTPDTPTMREYSGPTLLNRGVAKMATPPAHTLEAKHRAKRIYKEPTAEVTVASGPEIPKGVIRAGWSIVFTWDFGDGTSTSTTSPTVEHDFFAAIRPDDDCGIFTVTCTVSVEGEGAEDIEDVTVSRTLVLHSAYALCKKQGAIVPHSKGDVFAKEVWGGLSGGLELYNIEDFPLVLDQRAIVPMRVDDDGDDLAIPEFTALGTPITIEANSSTLIEVGAQYSESLLGGSPGFTVYFGGSGNGTKVRLSHTFELTLADQHGKAATLQQPGELDVDPGPWWAGMNPHAIPGVVTRGDPDDNPVAHRAKADEVARELEVKFGHINGFGRNSTVVDVASGTIAVNLGPNSAGAISKHMRANIDSVLWEVLGAAHQQQGLARSTLTVQEATGRMHGIGAQPPMHTMGGRLDLPIPGIVAEGQYCDPDHLDNLTEEEEDKVEAQDLQCLLDEEGPKKYTMPARFMNARKGDIILSPGGSGVIATLLQQVSPPQIYSHTGIMTRNHDEITHSTASEDRLTDEDQRAGWWFSSSGIIPNTVQYLWPGVVRQSVDAAVNGEDFVSPEGETYSIGSFSKHEIQQTHNEKFHMVPPLVVKPEPYDETQTVRSALHAAAAEAAIQAGTPEVPSKSHYRLYGYTDPAWAAEDIAGDDAGWAAGTYGTVCSSFVWHSHKKVGNHLETMNELVTQSDLEPSDVKGEARLGADNPDGLYLYTAKERRVAAQWLYDYVFRVVKKKAGTLGHAITDAADNTANQIVNTFVNDDAHGKDSEAWKQTRKAIAVSPDDILFWDAPSTGGLYGFVEPLQYRESREETYTPSKWKKVPTRGTVHGKVTYNDGEAVGGAQVHASGVPEVFSDRHGNYVIHDVGYGEHTLYAQKSREDEHGSSVLLSSTSTLRVSTTDTTRDIELQEPPERYRLAELTVDFHGVDDEINWNFWDGKNPDQTKDAHEVFLFELGPDRTICTKSLKYQWGGEVRVDYQITLSLLANNDIRVQADSQLYEGTNDGDDLDDMDIKGQKSIDFSVPRGDTQSRKLETKNENDHGILGGDRAKLTITVHNGRNNN